MQHFRRHSLTLTCIWNLSLQEQRWQNYKCNEIHLQQLLPLTLCLFPFVWPHAAIRAWRTHFYHLYTNVAETPVVRNRLASRWRLSGDCYMNPLWFNPFCGAYYTSLFYEFSNICNITQPWHFLHFRTFFTLCQIFTLWMCIRGRCTRVVEVV